VQTAPSILAACDGLMISPGSPCLSMDGALATIRYARENGIPLLGTCAGFQHILVEYARHVLGITGAAHAGVNPDAAELICIPLTCSPAHPLASSVQSG
jgi:CTP synthase (UTP-ammonia lyase)